MEYDTGDKISQSRQCWMLMPLSEPVMIILLMHMRHSTSMSWGGSSGQFYRITVFPLEIECIEAIWQTSIHIWEKMWDCDSDFTDWNMFPQVHWAISHHSRFRYLLGTGQATSQNYCSTFGFLSHSEASMTERWNSKEKSHLSYDIIGYVCGIVVNITQCPQPNWTLIYINH